MNIDLLHLHIDTEKLKRDVKQSLKDREMDYADLGRSIGYSESAISKYMASNNGSSFITAALIERFNYDPNEYMKEGFKHEGFKR